MNIINVDLKSNQLEEVKQMIKNSSENMEKRYDLMLVLSDGQRVLLLKRENQIIVQSIDSLEI